MTPGQLERLKAWLAPDAKLSDIDLDRAARVAAYRAQRGPMPDELRQEAILRNAYEVQREVEENRMRPLDSIELIILHRCESGLTGEEVKVAEAKRGLGYHYFVRRDGTVDQMYDIRDETAHACAWNATSIAIALQGCFDPKMHGKFAHPTVAQLEAARKLCLDIWTTLAREVPIAGHTSLPAATTDPTKSCPGANFAVEEFAASVWRTKGQRK